MTALDSPQQSAHPLAARSRPAGVLVGLVGFLPVAWVLGATPVLWIVVALPLGRWLVANRHDLVVPRHLPVWIVFLAMVAMSSVQLDGFGAAAVFSMRYAWYLSATLLLLYLVNQRGPEASVTVVRSMVALWVIAIAGGWAGLLFPDLEWQGLFGRLLPAVVRETDFIRDLTSPATAEVQSVRGEVFERPSAPFAYTNNWGSTLALLTPFAVLAFVDRRYRLSRLLLVVLAALAVVPLAQSLNRGAWLTLSLGVLYGLWRLVRSGRRVAVLSVIVLFGIVIGVGVVSGAIGSIADQTSTRSGDSTDTRSALYIETIEAAIESPILGYGSPRESESNDGGPPVGTQGQLWLVLFSHGFIAAGCYVLFFALTHVTFPPATQGLTWAKAVLVIGLFQVPIYGQLPQQLFILMTAVALLYLLQREGTTPSAPIGQTNRPGVRPRV